MRKFVRLAPFAALALAACASLPPLIPEVAECRAAYLAIDARVDAADARNGGTHRIDGFPYLRSDRFLASFAEEAPDGPAFDAWVERMRRLDLLSREPELRNLGWSEPGEELSHLDRCGADWAARDLKDPARRAALRERAAVPDDYSWWRRALGLYPVAVPFLNLGISDFNREVAADYAKPLPLLDVPGRPVLWVENSLREPPGEAAAIVARAAKDALGIPQLGSEQWQVLARAHSPSWIVEERGAYDQPGAVGLRDGKPAVDIARPTTYSLTTYTRFGGKVLAQLVYVVWFTERPKEGWLDSYAGALDGVVWRVTLDTDGQPLLYDTIHACGCYHYYFLARPLRRKPQDSFWQEPVLFPQEAPAQPFAVRLQSGTHYVRRLVPMNGADVAETRNFSRLPYGVLLSLPDEADGMRSLFREDGLVCGTERFERFWLWPAGIKSAGAMRQWGRHATSFVGRSHFDDPGMMDRLFKASD